MYKLFYTKTMSPVTTGDVVHFGSKAWTVDEVCNSEEYLKCWVWVRSMDEQHLTIRVSGGEFDARFIQTRVDDDHYRVTTTDTNAHILNLSSGESMTCNKIHYYQARVDDGMSVGQYFKQYF
jgi:hypothetical protein